MRKIITTAILPLMFAVEASSQIIPPNFPNPGKMCLIRTQGDLNVVGPALETTVKNTQTLSGNLSAYCNGRPSTKSYNDNTVNSFFCDSIELPANIDINQGVLLNINTGRTQPGVGTDAASAGRMGASNAYLAPAASTGNVTGNTTVRLNLTPVIMSQVDQNPDGSLNKVIDVIVQDDTEVLSTTIEYCAVPTPVVVLEFEGCHDKSISVDGPWGHHDVELFEQGDLVVFNTNGTQNEQGYHPILWELNKGAWTSTGYTRIDEWGGWECAACSVPQGLIANNYLPQGYNSGQGFKKDTLYYFGLAVGPVWTSEGHYFYIAP